MCSAPGCPQVPGCPRVRVPRLDANLGITDIVTGRSCRLTFMPRPLASVCLFLAGGPQLPSVGNCGVLRTTLELCHADSIAATIPTPRISLPLPVITAIHISHASALSHEGLRLRGDARTCAS